jgi:hypothetical protein
MQDPLNLAETNINLKAFTRYVIDSRYKMVHEKNLETALEFLAISNALGGEVGELQNIVKKIIKNGDFYNDSDLHDKFVLEAGDALHYLVSLITAAGYTLEFVMSCNVQKLDARRAENEAQETAVLTETTAQS